MLTKRQMCEIAEFDMKRRLGKKFDGRRYGSITGEPGDKIPAYTSDWTRCYGVNPQDVRAGVKRKKPVRKTLRYNYIVPKGKEVTVVHVAVRLDAGYQPVVKDVARWHLSTGLGEFRDMDYRGLAGWVVEWSRRDYAGVHKRGAAPFYGQRTDDHWFKLDKWQWKGASTFPWHETVNPEALKGTRYEYCQYDKLQHRSFGLVDWLMLYKQEPKIELLVKAGLECLACPSGLKALKDRHVFDFAREHAAQIARSCRDPRTIAYAAKHNTSLRVAQNHYDFISVMQNAFRWADFDGRRPKLDYERLRKAIRKWGASPEEYVRYLEHAAGAGYDLRNVGTLYPPVTGGRAAFMGRLEAMEVAHVRKMSAEERRERRRAAKERAEAAKLLAERDQWVKQTMQSRFAEIEAFQTSLKRVDTIAGCGYKIVLAKSQKELLAEGRRMDNCVGDGLYGEGIVAGNTLIVTIQDPKNTKNRYCVEINRKAWDVRQCYGRHNTQAPEEIRELSKQLAECFKAEYIRQKKRKMFPELADGRKKFFAA